MYQHEEPIKHSTLAARGEYDASRIHPALRCYLQVDVMRTPIMTGINTASVYC